MAKGTPEGALAAYAGLPTGQPSGGGQQFRSGVQQYLSSPFTLNSVPQAAMPRTPVSTGYVPTQPAPPAAAAASGAPSAPAGPVMGQPNINAPVGSYEWWTAYNPGADYDRHFGGGGR